LTSETSNRSKIAVGLAPILLAGALLLADSVLANPVVTERVSIDSEGNEANGASSDPSINTNGRYIVFSSDAVNLVAGDLNGARDIFVHDWIYGTTERISVTSDGQEAQGDSNLPSISLDGRFVAFTSEAANLVSGDNNGVADVFVHDRHSDPAQPATVRISLGTDEAEANGMSSTPVISANGRYVAFYSEATNLVPGGTNNIGNIFVYDRQDGVTEWISVPIDGGEPDGISDWPSISADGRFVAYSSQATNLIQIDINNRRDIFVRDRDPDQPKTEIALHPLAARQPARATCHPSAMTDGISHSNPMRATWYPATRTAWRTSSCTIDSLI
jgi:Tol biopolymer transport system component